MDREKLEKMLSLLADREITVNQAMEQLKLLPYQDLNFARIDNHRSIRCGFPEVIFCEGKRPEQTAEIFNQMVNSNRTVLGTRASYRMFAAVRSLCPAVQYYKTARCIVYGMPDEPLYPAPVLVISAGTTDLPAAEEAAVCAQAMGNTVLKLFDVGVAGLHRLLDYLELIQKAAVTIVVAGMEGALPSVVGGLTDRPVIAVPTSTGYGASFGGLAALLGMLNSCTPGVGVVNIDNGFGAASLATAINRTIKSSPAL
ncbi:MAG TPA: nickel pincer cofactor biosynthesis protein LarB [Desulfotomaculum sp.]|nr:MAG: 1-(5-phosphoribosyl)-5-amino-4-imidazole-carboxylate (AIR) carboxylase [Desulfotomaculum sp. 46_80]KUK85203.1 MAG: 1-(5-phosphoribosyl)-5-amino-4-imidazole-carboxylate (AIR) carboxylase [Desulfofundulus kuznetsovii]HAG10531.1 nickel pincer cofactor biosynthesis protein LarB [Desulfotomaculum sp.]HBY03293.1 nickel pincer cofactor biosynthesis protein LarB [Desulfotomaculum sp.]